MTKQKSSDSISFWEKITIITALGFFLFLLLQNTSLPFVGYNAWNFNTYSLIAHNYLNFGLLETRFAPVISVDTSLPDHPEYYLKHPPLLSLVQAASFAIFGESYFTARLPVLLAALLSIVGLSLLAKQLFGRRVAVITLVVTATMPGSSIFGKMVGQESIMLCFVIFAFYFLSLFQKTKKQKYLCLVAVFTTLATLTDWPGVYLGLLLGAYLFLTTSRAAGVFVGLSGLLPATVYALYIRWLTGSFEVLTGGFLVRSLGELLRRENWAILWVGTIVFRLIVYFNVFFVVLVGVFALTNRNVLARYPYVVICLLFLFGLIHVLLYPEGSFGHPYWLYYLYPAIVLGVSVMLSRLWKKNRLIVVTIFFIAIVQTLIVTHWKEQEIQGNLFRYELGAIAAMHIPQFETIGLREGGLLDPDILAYSFSIPSEKITENTIDERRYQYILFSCFNVCDQDPLLVSLSAKHQSLSFLGENVSMTIVIIGSKKEDKVTAVPIASPVSEDGFFQKSYRKILALIGAPQL